MNQYGDISPRTAAYAATEMLKRGVPYLCLEKFGQGKPVPTNKTKSATWRRYEALSATPVALTEGVTPSSKTLTVTDVTATLTQFGDLVTITDVIMDTHEDQVLNETLDVLGEQAPQMIETMRFNIVKAGTNVEYSGDGSIASRATVVSPIAIGMQRRITRALKRQNARKVTRVIKSTPAYGTEAVAPSFVALCHPDLEGDIRNMPGFTPTEKYGNLTPYENELGKVEDVRYLTSTIFAPFADAGGAAATMLATTDPAVHCDVYPILFIAQDAYGIVPLKGKAAVTPMVVNPKPSDSDPLGQRGHASWKSMQTAVILNDAWMCRGEVSCSSNPTPA